MHPDRNPQSLVGSAGFCVWGRMKEDIGMQWPRDGHRQGGGVLRRILIGGWRSHYGGILPED